MKPDFSLFVNNKNSKYCIAMSGIIIMELSFIKTEGMISQFCP